jgi:hypothetical protein
MAEPLISIDEVKLHLRLVGTTEHDSNLEMKIEEATDLVVDYLKNHLGTDEERAARFAEIDAWTYATVPKPVRSAIFRMVGHLFRFTGDDDQAQVPKLQHGDLPQDVTMFLKRYRDPAFA